MQLAGYKFRVLNNAFLIHWTYQARGWYKDMPRRLEQMRQNDKVFYQIAQELALKYGDPYNMLEIILKFKRRKRGNDWNFNCRNFRL